MQILHKLKSLSVRKKEAILLDIEDSSHLKNGIDVNEMSKDELKKLHDFIALEENYRKKKLTTLLVTMAMIAGLFLVARFINLDTLHTVEEDKAVTNFIEEEKLEHNENALFVSFKRKRRNFEQHLQRGDELARSKYLYQALEEYKKAQLLFPEAYKINFRITYTCTEICKRYKSNCSEAEKLILELQQKYPDREEVKALNKEISMELPILF